MRITGIGINGDAAHLGGSLARLEEDLPFFQRCGFDAVELSPHGLGMVINGRLQQRQVDRVRAIIERFGFVYTAHVPDRLNLAFPPRGSTGTPELAHEQDVFVACLDFCAAIGAGVTVYHSGLIALQQAAFELEAPPDDEAPEQAREQEVSALRALIPLAAERGVVVAMENRDPHPWEVATLVRAGLPANQLLKYHAGMAIPNLVRQVESEPSQPGPHPRFCASLSGCQPLRLRLPGSHPAGRAVRPPPARQRQLWTAARYVRQLAGTHSLWGWRPASASRLGRDSPRRGIGSITCLRGAIHPGA